MSLVKVISTGGEQSGGGSDPALEARVAILESNERKVVYFESVMAESGQVTPPTGATILLNQLPAGADALVSTISSGIPTGIPPQTAGGAIVDVATFDTMGNYTLTGTPSAFPVAIIYYFKISDLDWQNITLDPNVLEDVEMSTLEVGVTPTTATVGSIFFAGVARVFEQNNAMLFWDNTNNIFYVGANSGAFTNTKGHFEATVNSFSQVNSINKSSGTSASTDFICTADTGTDSTNYVDMGINSSTYSDAAYTIGGALSSYLYSNGGTLTVGTQSSQALIFHTGGTLAANERIRINPFGYTGFNMSQKLAQMSMTAVADITNVGGTTTANASSTITGVGTDYLNRIAVGDDISLSSAASTYSRVTTITSATSLTTLNTLGNGTSQTINVKKSLFSYHSGVNYYFGLSAGGELGIGAIPVVNRLLNITTSTASVLGIVVTTTTGIGITSTSTTATAGSFSSTGNRGITTSTTSTNVAMCGAFIRTVDNSNTHDRCVEVCKTLSSGTGSIGAAASIYLQVPNASGVNGLDACKIQAVATAVTAGSEITDLVFFYNINGTLTEAARLVASATVPSFNIVTDFKLTTVGKGIYVKEGTNATMGIATLVAGTVTVNTTKVTANSRIFLTRQTNAGTVGGSVDVTARTAGTSFTITSGNALDTSDVAWIIIEPS